uniref:MAGE domain-containing protein n=1 Tax=Sus scrofa TaxID=9823 RepID=A0A4X1VC72_PIG
FLVFPNTFYCDQCLQTFTKSQDLEVAQVSEALEETHLSSHSVIIPKGPQSFCSSASTATSSTELDEGSMSQEEDSPGTSQAAPDTENVLIDDLDDKVVMLMIFLLLKYQMQEPITEEEMLKIVDNCQAHFPEILMRTSEHMEIIFGLDLKEVDPANHRYDLLIKLGLTYDGMLHGEVGMPKTGILLLILGVIFMKGNCATEDEVWEVLSVIGVYSGRKHLILGEPRKLITEDFVKEKYLEYRQVANTDPAQFEFLWGPRAHAETTKMKVLEFLAKVHGIDPSSFPSQYEEALQDEEERA